MECVERWSVGVSSLLFCVVRPVTRTFQRPSVLCSVAESSTYRLCVSIASERQGALELPECVSVAFAVSITESVAS